MNIDIDNTDLTAATPVSGNTATHKQIEFITRLKSDRDIDQATLDAMRDDWREGRFDVRTASEWIEVLLAAPRPAAPSAPADAPQGMHKHGIDVYKVQIAVHGSGRPYAKQLVEVSPNEWKFQYAPGAIRHLSEETLMSKEEAQRFGRVTGTCCVCGRTLTDEVSIANGIGPICAEKF